MENCWYIHPDNIEESKKQLNLKAAVIARPDWFMEETSPMHLIVETHRGVHTRCYYGKKNGIPFLIIYGRFERVRGTSLDIDFESTQEVISFLGITQVIGTYVVGSIKDDDMAGTVYIPDDFIGFGGYNQSRNRKEGFRNVDMFTPFCVELRGTLVNSASALPFAVKDRGVYACFHGYPRIETAAELEFYNSLGCDIVGQTLDPEATLAREAGCHYSALAVTIDDHHIRKRFLANDNTAVNDINRHIEEGRKKTFDVFLEALPAITQLEQTTCNCREQGIHVKKRCKYFYYRPGYLQETV